MRPFATDSRGFSLIEMCIALLVAVLILGATAYFMRGQNGSYVGQRERLSSEDTLRLANDFVGRMLKGATALPAVSVTGANCASSVTFSYAEDFGASTGGNANNTLNDTGRTWTNNQWAGYRIVITNGGGSGQTRTIGSNTASEIVVTADWVTLPDTTSLYKIVSDRELSLTGTTLQYRNTSAGSALEPLADRITCFNVQQDPTYGNQYNITITSRTATVLPDTGRFGITTLNSSVDVRN